DDALDAAMEKARCDRSLSILEAIKADVALRKQIRETTEAAERKAHEIRNAAEWQIREKRNASLGRVKEDRQEALKKVDEARQAARNDLEVMCPHLLQYENDQQKR